MSAITNASLETDLRLATAMDFEIQRILNETFSVEQLGIHTVVGPVNGRGADTIRVPYADLDGSASMADTAEAATVAPTAFTDASEDVVVARKAVRYDLSDLAAGTGATGNVDVMRLSQMIVQHRRTRLNIDFATAWASGTQSVANSGADCTVTNFYAAQYLARVNLVPSINGRYIALLKPETINQLITSFRSETGILIEKADLQDFAGVKATPMAGQIGDTIVIGLDDVTDDGTDHYGAILGAGALLFGYLDPPLPAAGSGSIAQKFAGLPGFMLETKREATDAMNTVVGNQWHGVTLRDERCVVLQTGV